MMLSSSETDGAGLADNVKDAPEQIYWPGRTAFDIGIYPEDLSDTAKGGIAFAEDSAVVSAISHSNHQFWRRHCIVCPL